MHRLAIQPSRRSRGPDQHGFTLVEVMISLVITSMILSTLYSALSAVGRTWNSGAERIAVAEQRRAGINFVRLELSQLAPLRLRKRSGETIVFEGGTDELIFAAPIPSHRASGGLFLVSLLLDDSKRPAHLTFRYKRLTVDRAVGLGEDDDDWEEKVLIDDIETMAFEYLGDDEAGTDKSWADTWVSDAVYPQAIRLKLDFQADDIPWPDLVVPIRARPQKRTRRLALMLREPRATDRRRESLYGAAKDRPEGFVPEEDPEE